LDENDHHQTKIEIQLDKRRELIFDLNSLCILEERFGSPKKAYNKLEKMQMKTVRTFLYAGLSHYDDIKSEQQVGKMLEMRDMADVIDMMVKAFAEQFSEE